VTSARDICGLFDGQNGCRVVIFTLQKSAIQQLMSNPYPQITRLPSQAGEPSPVFSFPDSFSKSPSIAPRRILLLVRMNETGDTIYQ
jgi:hypothetical protein